MKVGFDPRPVMSSVYALYRGDDDAKFIDALVARGTQVVKVFDLFLDFDMFNAYPRQNG